MNRRGFLLGLGAALAAPAIVPYASLMPVKLARLTAADVRRVDNFMRANALSAEQLEVILTKKLTEHARKWFDRELYSIFETGSYTDGTRFGSQALVDSYARAAVI